MGLGQATMLIPDDVTRGRDSIGWALEDLVAARLLLEHAESLAVGSQFEVTDSKTDPRNPYESLIPSRTGQPRLRISM